MDLIVEASIGGIDMVVQITLGCDLNKLEGHNGRCSVTEGIEFKQKPGTVFVCQRYTGCDRMC